MEPISGGPSFAVKQMASSLAAESGIRYFFSPRLMDDTWSFSWKLWERLQDNISIYDVLHISGVFTLPVLVTTQEIKK
tara:strand:- start:119 stop:352 length:234 start_codon:yes stop_codon:yes gene_type:complete